MKDIFCDVSNERVKDTLKRNILERLWLLAMSMRDKKNVASCGTVLNKSAKGNEYRWGLRFYILLIECFRQWASFTADDEINSKYNDLRKKVPIIEDDVYYFQALEHQYLDHHKADQLLNDYNDGDRSPGLPQSVQSSNMRSNVAAPVQNSYAPPSINSNDPPEIREFSKYKQAYLNALFSKSPDLNDVFEQHTLFQSFFETEHLKLNVSKLTPSQRAEYEFAERINRLTLDDIQTPKGLQQLRSKVVGVMASTFGEVPPEYQRLAGGNNAANSGPQANTRSNMGPRDIDLYQYERYLNADNDVAEPVKPPKPQEDNYGSNVQKSAGFPNQQSTQFQKGGDQQAIAPSYDSFKDPMPQIQPIFQSNFDRAGGLPSDSNSRKPDSLPPKIDTYQDQRNPPSDTYSYPGSKIDPLPGFKNNASSPTKGGDQYQPPKPDFTKKNSEGKPAVNSEQNKDLNRQLRDKKRALQQEIDRLKNQERKMRESVNQKSVLSTLQKVENTPEVLIEEIERKNRAYENLQNKYAALLSQMNSKVHNNLEKSYLSGSHMSKSRIEPDTSSYGSQLFMNSLYGSRLYAPDRSSYGGSSKYFN